VSSIGPADSLADSYVTSGQPFLRHGRKQSCVHRVRSVPPGKTRHRQMGGSLLRPPAKITQAGDR
jgi:hypothetical protein